MKKSYFLMLMALAFFLSGCREELDYVNSENTQNTYQLNKDNVKTQILHKTDYEKRSFLKPSVSRIENYLNTGSGGNSSLSKHTAVQDNYEIYTDTFEEVSYLDAKYHSFYIIGDPSSGIEEKLILKSINNQVTEKYILKYRRLPDFSIDANSYQTVKITESFSGNGESLQVFTDSFSMGCSTYTVTYMDCEVPGYHHTNGEYCDAYNIIIPYNTVTVSFDPTCTSGSGSQTQGGAAGNTGTSTGGAPANNTIPPGETPPVITLPTTAPLYIIQRPRNVICNPLDLNQDEIDQLNGNYNIRLKIYQYLALQGYSPSVCGDLPIDQEVQDFVKFTLHFFAQNPTTTWQQFQNWFLEEPVSGSLQNELFEDWADPTRVKPTTRFKKHIKINSIYNKIKTAANFKQYLQNFEPTFSVAHLMFDIGAVENPAALAQTKTPVNYWIKITFNKDWDFANTPKILIAGSFMHEIIHAEMYRKLLSLSSSNGNIDQALLGTMLNQHNYPGLFDYYIKNVKGNDSAQHQMMGAHYINIIKNALKQVYGNQYTDVEYLSIAWQGLKNTTAWSLLPQAERDLYEQTYQNNYNLWEK